MHFGDVTENAEPANDVFLAAHSLVFDKGDGSTEHLERLSEDARLVYLIWCFEGEIYNGGFDQLFVNSLGNHCQEILVNLEKIGAHNSRALLLRATGWYPNGAPSANRQERWKQAQALASNQQYLDAIEILDSEYYEDKDDMTGLLNAFVRGRPNATVGA